jgi:uncharacterized protein (DUF1684 family)
LNGQVGDGAGRAEAVAGPVSQTAGVDDHGVTLLDWRRRIQALYAAIRAAPDAAEAHTQWRAVRDDLFARHPQSPIAAERRAAFIGVPVATYDPRWRFEIELDADVPPLRLEIPTGTDGIVPFERIATAHIADVGQLDVWALRSYGGGLFVPLRDRTSGRTSYGGGRYLIDTAKGADLGGGVDPLTGIATLVLDFNFAYHPSCAYDVAWACPLAPAGNVLEVDLPVGEQLPSGGWF